MTDRSREVIIDTLEFVLESWKNISPFESHRNPAEQIDKLATALQEFKRDQPTERPAVSEADNHIRDTPKMVTPDRGIVEEADKIARIAAVLDEHTAWKSESSNAELFRRLPGIVDELNVLAARLRSAETPDASEGALFRANAVAYRAENPLPELFESGEEIDEFLAQIRPAKPAITAEELAEMAKICDAATPGPWTTDEMMHYNEDGSPPTETGFAEGISGPKDCRKAQGESNDDYIVDETLFLEDAVFITNARTDMPRLIAILQKLVKP